jgi:hypothetical protein
MNRKEKEFLAGVYIKSNRIRLEESEKSEIKNNKKKEYFLRCIYFFLVISLTTCLLIKYYSNNKEISYLYILIFGLPILSSLYDNEFFSNVKNKI